MEREQKKLWNMLMAAWNEGVACHLHFARIYTEKYPDDMYGWIALADVLSKIAFYEEAMIALRAAKKLSPDDKLDFVYAAKGHYYREKGDYSRAESWYRKAVDVNETDRHLVLLGACLAKQGKHEEAKQCHRRAIKIGSKVVDEAYFNLGLILRAEGKHEKALECFDKAIEINRKYNLAKIARKDTLTLLKTIKGN